MMVSVKVNTPALYTVPRRTTMSPLSHRTNPLKSRDEDCSTHSFIDEQERATCQLIYRVPEIPKSMESTTCGTNISRYFRGDVSSEFSYQTEFCTSGHNVESPPADMSTTSCQGTTSDAGHDVSAAVDSDQTGPRLVWQANIKCIAETAQLRPNAIQVVKGQEVLIPHSNMFGPGTLRETHAKIKANFQQHQSYCDEPSQPAEVQRILAELEEANNSKATSGLASLSGSDISSVRSEYSVRSKLSIHTAINTTAGGVGVGAVAGGGLTSSDTSNSRISFRRFMMSPGKPVSPYKLLRSIPRANNFIENFNFKQHVRFDPNRIRVNFTEPKNTKLQEYLLRIHERSLQPEMDFIEAPIANVTIPTSKAHQKPAERMTSSKSPSMRVSLIRRVSSMPEQVEAIRAAHRRGGGGAAPGEQQTGAIAAALSSRRPTSRSNEQQHAKQHLERKRRRSSLRQVGSMLPPAPVSPGTREVSQAEVDTGIADAETAARNGSPSLNTVEPTQAGASSTATSKCDGAVGGAVAVVTSDSGDCSGDSVNKAANGDASKPDDHFNGMTPSPASSVVATVGVQSAPPRVAIETIGSAEMDDNRQPVGMVSIAALVERKQSDYSSIGSNTSLFLAKNSLEIPDYTEGWSDLHMAEYKEFVRLCREEEDAESIGYYGNENEVGSRKEELNSSQDAFDLTAASKLCHRLSFCKPGKKSQTEGKAAAPPSSLNDDPITWTNGSRVTPMCVANSIIMKELLARKSASRIDKLSSPVVEIGVGETTSKVTNKRDQVNTNQVADIVASELQTRIVDHVHNIMNQYSRAFIDREDEADDSDSSDLSSFASAHCNLTVDNLGDVSDYIQPIPPYAYQQHPHYTALGSAQSMAPVHSQSAGVAAAAAYQAATSLMNAVPSGVSSGAGIAVGQLGQQTAPAGVAPATVRLDGLVQQTQPIHHMPLGESTFLRMSSWGTVPSIKAMLALSKGSDEIADEGLERLNRQSDGQAGECKTMWKSKQAHFTPKVQPGQEKESRLEALRSGQRATSQYSSDRRSTTTTVGTINSVRENSEMSMSIDVPTTVQTTSTEYQQRQRFETELERANMQPYPQKPPSRIVGKRFISVVAKVPELAEVPRGLTLLAAKIKMHDMGLKPRNQQEEMLQKAYAKAILEDLTLRRMFTLRKKRFLPQEMRILPKLFADSANAQHGGVNGCGAGGGGSGGSPSQHGSVGATVGATADGKAKFDMESDNDRFFHTSLSKASNSVVGDIMTQFLEAEMFTTGMFQCWFYDAYPDRKVLRAYNVDNSPTTQYAPSVRQGVSNVGTAGNPTVHQRSRASNQQQHFLDANSGVEPPNHRVSKDPEAFASGGLGGVVLPNRALSILNLPLASKMPSYLENLVSATRGHAPSIFAPSGGGGGNRFSVAQSQMLLPVPGNFASARQQTTPNASGVRKPTPTAYKITQQTINQLASEMLHELSNTGGGSRRAMLSLLATSVLVPEIRTLMWTSPVGWLEPILLSMFSCDRIVREEATYVLGYIFTETNLSRDFALNTTFDLARDVVAAILRAIELRPESFMHFYCLLGLIFDGCPAISALECLLDKAPHSQSKLVQHLWPRLISVIVRHWPTSAFSSERNYAKQIVEALERAYLRPISRRYATHALAICGLKCHRKSRLLTYWSPDWANQSIFKVH